ncbi:rhodanese-like domain-containing protein [Lyngbya confervoides BDU141951]|uniref:Rhodanese-like domain-containing protein n=1 Tax=Lyngbya confervoides BDU141951 TaxID=1574623 RepID=A0ABD4T1A5_9CYAN|nr:rhodanese-like domain-containing protein [Lyngbya confervoides]MCM1982181.1 rhodanese-like domain-containing protein [Lyngbya confervoides BDU141951]
MPEITVEAFQSRLHAGGSSLQLIDVREPQEINVAALQGFQNFPLSQYQLWQNTILETLDPRAETYVLCHHGMRSAQMCAWLIHQGFTQVINIGGGIDAYSRCVDPSVPRY